MEDKQEEKNSITISFIDDTGKKYGVVLFPRNFDDISFQFERLDETIKSFINKGDFKFSKHYDSVWDNHIKSNKK